MLLFTDWVSEPDLQYLIGFSMVAVISFNLLVNLIIVFYCSASALRLIAIVFKHKALSASKQVVFKVRQKLGFEFQDIRFAPNPEYKKRRF